MILRIKVWKNLKCVLCRNILTLTDIEKFAEIAIQETDATGCLLLLQLILVNSNSLAGTEKNVQIIWFLKKKHVFSYFY